MIWAFFKVFIEKFKMFFKISCFVDVHTKFKPINESKFTDSLPEIYDLPINVVNNAIFYQKELIDNRKFKVFWENCITNIIFYNKMFVVYG